ncbi:MAG: hypothetical protein J6A61_07565 [Clostridia bacterium]|nr:hypothetical protein [Clostridia bacterium]
MKIVRRILLVLVCLILVGFLAYKIAYPYVAPLVFDYLVDHNLNAFIKLEQSLSESLPEEVTDPQSDADGTTDSQKTSGDEPDSKAPLDASEESVSSQISDTDAQISPSEKPAPQGNGVSNDEKTPAGEKPDTDIQAVKTTMGVFSGEHLARALKNMSPKDKTRIISLCQSAVSTSDILKVSKMMMQDGLTKEQQKYIENYLRDNLSVPNKREILEILKKY